MQEDRVAKGGQGRQIEAQQVRQVEDARFAVGIEGEARKYVPAPERRSARPQPGADEGPGRIVIEPVVAEEESLAQRQGGPEEGNGNRGYQEGHPVPLQPASDAPPGPFRRSCHLLLVRLAASDTMPLYNSRRRSCGGFMCLIMVVPYGCCILG